MTLFILMTAALLTGMVTPWQTAVNARIRGQLNSALLASFVNCAVGVGLLFLLMVISKESFYRDVGPLLQLPWWYFASGPLGALILLIALIILPRLGLVGTTIAMMSGMILSGVIFDHFALFELEQHLFDLPRALGLLLILIGIMLTLQVHTYLKHHCSEVHAAAVLWFALGLISGCCVTTQGAINALFRQELDSMLYCALFSMAVTALICLVLAACTGRGPGLLLKLQVKGRLYEYTGGVMGVINICGNALLMPIIGAGTLMTLIIAGQILCSMILDHFGVLGLKRRPITAVKIAGLVIIAAGICCIKLV